MHPLLARVSNINNMIFRSCDMLSPLIWWQLSYSDWSHDSTKLEQDLQDVVSWCIEGCSSPCYCDFGALAFLSYDFGALALFSYDFGALAFLNLWPWHHFTYFFTMNMVILDIENVWRQFSNELHAIDSRYMLETNLNFSITPSCMYTYININFITVSKS